MTELFPLKVYIFTLSNSIQLHFAIMLIESSIKRKEFASIQVNFCFFVVKHHKMKFDIDLG